MLKRMFLALMALAMAGTILSATPVLAQSAAGSTDYVLDTGDKLKVTVYGEEDLSGEFAIDGAGNVMLPMVGQLPAAGRTLAQFSDAFAKVLIDRKYLVKPRVSAEVTNYRPFTILGEVNKPGQYPFENGMTALNAVAIAGGFTYRANQRVVLVRRKGVTREQELPADDRTRIFPGDTVRVDERIF